MTRRSLKKPVIVVGVVLLAGVAGVAGFLVTAGGPGDLARQALAAYEAGEFATAREGYERAIAQDPDHEPSVIGLAEVAIAEQDPDRVRKYAERAIAASEDPAQRGRLRLALARTQIDDGEYEGAFDLAGKAAEDGAPPEQVAAVMGLAKLGEGKQEEAYLLLTTAASAGSTASRVYSALTQLQLARGEDSPALTSAERAVELAPQDPALWVIAAELRARAGDRVGARAALEQAVGLEPGNTSAQAQLALHQLEAGELEPALAAARQAHEAGPDNPRTTIALARVLLAQGEHAEAHDLLSQQQEHLGWEGRLLLGVALLSAGKTQAGLEALEAVASSRPDDGSVQLEAGRAALGAGAAAEAVGFYRLAVELDGSYPARLGLARALGAEDRGQHHAAILDQLKAAREANPKATEAVAALAEHYVLVGAADRAQAVVADALQSAPQDPALLFWKGRAALAQSDWDTAVQALEACQQASSAFPEVDRWLQRARDHQP